MADDAPSFRRLFGLVPFDTGEKMPFSLLHDPGDLARARRALDTAWAKIEKLGLVRGSPESERPKLACAVAGLLNQIANEHELVAASIAQFLYQREQGQ